MGEVPPPLLPPLPSPGTHPWDPDISCSGNQGGGRRGTQRHRDRSREGSRNPTWGLGGCLPRLGAGTESTAAKASSLRDPGDLGVRDGAMVRARGRGAEEVG